MPFPCNFASHHCKTLNRSRTIALGVARLQNAFTALQNGLAPLQNAFAALFLVLAVVRGVFRNRKMAISIIVMFFCLGYAQNYSIRKHKMSRICFSYPFLYILKKVYFSPPNLPFRCFHSLSPSRRMFSVAADL